MGGNIRSEGPWVFFESVVLSSSCSPLPSRARRAHRPDRSPDRSPDRWPQRSPSIPPRHNSPMRPSSRPRTRTSIRIRTVVSGLAPGTDSVRTAAPNDRSFFVDQWYPAIAVAANGVRPQGVTVAAGGTTSGINFALTDVSGSISGSLTLARLPFTGQVTLPVVNVYNEDGFLVHTPQLSATPGATAGSPITADPHAGPVRGHGRPPVFRDGRYYVKTSNAAAVSGEQRTHRR